MSQALPLGHSQAKADGPRIRKLGNLSLNLDTYRLAVGARMVSLTHRECELLRLLLEQPDRIVGYEALANAVWGSNDRRAIRHLQVVVHGLRAKLAGCQPYRIETVRGRGYGLLKGSSADGADAAALQRHLVDEPDVPSRRAR